MRQEIEVQSNSECDENDPFMVHESMAVKNEKVVYSHDAQLVLSKSIKTVYWVIVTGFFGAFSYSSRFAIWYLYAREFNDSTPHSIAWVLMAGFFSLGIIGLFYPCLADIIGYDKAIMIKLFIRCIGIFGECVAMNFAFLSVFYIISQVNLIAVCLAYIAWILPHNDAIKYTSYFYSGYAVFYLAGPITAGFLSHFMNYRAAFWFNFIFNIIMLILAVIFVSNKQKKLEIQQLALKDEFETSNMDKNYIFPVISHIDEDRSSFNAFWSSISKFEWFQLINVILQNSLTMTVEALFLSYYTVFIFDHFSGNAMIATTQLFVMCLGFIIGNASVPAIIDNKKLISPFNNASFVIIASSVLMIVLLIICFPLIVNIDLIWIINIFIGLLLGMSVMSQEILILKQQPTHHAGKISGIKEFLRKSIPAMAVLITGSLYSQNIRYAFIYVSGSCYCVSLFLSIIHLISQIYKQ